MNYYEFDGLCVRSMIEADIDDFYNAFVMQGWGKHAYRSRFENYFKQQNEDKRMVFVAEKNGEICGFGTVLLKVKKGPFFHKDIPELADFNVLVKFRNQGIGNKLVEIAENACKEKSEYISLAISLYDYYGKALRMYIKRGYIPDGSGLWYNGKTVSFGETCVNDDELVLYFTKKLI